MTQNQKNRLGTWSRGRGRPHPSPFPLGSMETYGRVDSQQKHFLGPGRPPLWASLSVSVEQPEGLCLHSSHMQKLTKDLKNTLKIQNDKRSKKI